MSSLSYCVIRKVSLLDVKCFMRGRSHRMHLQARAVGRCERKTFKLFLSELDQKHNCLQAISSHFSPCSGQPGCDIEGGEHTVRVRNIEALWALLCSTICRKVATDRQTAADKPTAHCQLARKATVVPQQWSRQSTATRKPCALWIAELMLFTHT